MATPKLVAESPKQELAIAVGLSHATRWVLRRFALLVNNLPNRFFSRTNQFAIDALLCASSLYLAYQLRFDGTVPVSQAATMWAWILIVPMLRPLCLWAFGAYDSIWRYFNLGDAIALAAGAVPTTALMLVMRFHYAGRPWITALPYTVAVIDLGVFLACAATARGMRRLIFEEARRSGVERLRTVVVGTEDTLAAALRQVSVFPDIRVVGLLATDARLRGLRLGGFSVMDEPAALPRLLALRSVELVLIADAKMDALGDVVSTAVEFGVDVRLLPSAANVMRGDVRVSAMPKPEMLLARRDSAENEVHPALIDAFERRVVLITGAGGSIGSELSRQVMRLPVTQVILLDHDENSIFEIHNELAALKLPIPIVPLVRNIRDREKIRTLFQQYSPDIVLHAAAYKHVPVMETNCCEAVMNNVTGTQVLAETAVAHGAERFLMISTDKAVKPTSIMGATKRMAELLVQSMARHSRTRLACVRFGNVVGSRGSVVPIFMRQIAAGGPITITDAEMTRYFMTIPEAVQLVLQAATLGSNGDIYMLDMGDPVKITNLARKLIEMSGLRPDKDIQIKFTGSRPGEKLHEQLWTEDAKVQPTSFSRVFAVHADAPPDDFASALARLQQAAMSYDDDAVRRSIKAMPIGFRTSVPLEPTRFDCGPWRKPVPDAESAGASI